MMNPGRYTARAVDAALGYTAGGKEQVAVAFQIIGGEHDGEALQWYGYFTEKTTERTIDSLRACGWTGDNIAQLDGISANEVSLVVVHEADQNGDMQVRVKWVNRAGSGAIQLKSRMDQGQALQFAQRMRGNVLAFDKQQVARTGGNGAAARPAQSGNRAPAPVDDDPLPF
jgi:hypothetical protein